MIDFTQKDIDRGGGILSALAYKSAFYIRSVIDRDRGTRIDFDFAKNSKLSKLHRTVVHQNAHLDEYLAELIFRACLPFEKMNIGFKELPIVNKTNDINCMTYWPNAAVFGMGVGVAGDVQPLFLYDEHEEDGTRDTRSCAQLVADAVFYRGRMPKSLYFILNEVNYIDSRGGAHPQNISNIMKSIHDALLLCNDGKTVVNQVLANPNPQWKRAVVDCCLAAVVHSNETGVNLGFMSNEMLRFYEQSLEYFVSKTPHRTNGRFDEALRKIREDYIGPKQTGYVLKNFGRYPKIRPSDIPLQQNLLLSRVSYSLLECWGEQIALFIMMHFWEVIFQSQIWYHEILEELEQFDNNVSGLMVTSHGRYEKVQSNECYILQFTPNPSVLTPKKAIMTFVNSKGSGISIVSNNMLMTNVISKSKAFPNDKWERLCREIDKLEPERWYLGVNEEKQTVYPYILNGNPTHQYTQPSDLTIEDILRLVESV